MPALPQQLDEIKKDQSRKNKIFSSEFCSCVQLAAELAAVSRDNCSCCVAGAADCCSCGRFRIAVRCMIRGEPEKMDKFSSLNYKIMYSRYKSFEGHRDS